MRIEYIVDTLTSVEIQEIVKFGVEVIQIFESVIYRENFKISPFKTVTDKLFELRQIYKDGNKDDMKLYFN